VNIVVVEDVKLQKSSESVLGKPKMLIKDQFRDSALWDYVIPRNTDIVIASCYKSGTTLTQQIINLLIRQQSHFDSIIQLSPWVESRLNPPTVETLEQLDSPRFFKSHLPFDALPYYPGWKYIYLVRDGRDVCLSLFHHCKSYLLKMDREGNPIDNGPDDFSEFWENWLETGKPRWAFWENIHSWWQIRHLPNVLLVHYTNLIGDKRKEAEKIARFLSLEWNEAMADMVCKYSSLEYMKEHCYQFEPTAGLFKPQTFINRGVNGYWKGLLHDAQVEHYESLAYQKLEPECAYWMITGTGKTMP